MTLESPLPRASVTTCPSCGSEVAAWEAYCEGCGAQLVPTLERPDSPPTDEIPVSRSVQLPGRKQFEPPAPRVCLECGGTVDADGYCELCGAKAPSERDHFTESPASWVGGVCDRGLRHSRNEDAMALAAHPGPGSRAVLVVCDGVSSSEDSDVASLAAARAACELLEAQHPVGMAVPTSRAHALTNTLVEAVQVANEAVVASTHPESTNAASCTLAAAVVSGDLIAFGNIGDSRVYWLADHGPSTQLSLDDSVAQMHISAGIDRAIAESGPQAHAITKWLAKDAPDLQPYVGTLEVPGHGWLMVCSDGLWNYASAPEELETELARVLLDHPELTDPTEVAGHLVRWANAQGGKDNITVALARFGPPMQLPEGAPESAAGHTGSTPTITQ